MGIQKIINDTIELENKKERKSSHLISPSSFGRCFRYQYWNRLGEEKSDPPTLLTLRKFKCGHLFHDFVQSFLPPHEREVEITEGDIHGYADIVLPDEVVDIKSVHSRKFWYMEKTNFDVVKDNLPHILQTCCYAHLLKKPKFTIMYVSKDDLCISEYSFYTDKYVHLVNDELKSLRFFWEKKTLPPKEPRAYGVDKKTGLSNECSKYCPYRTKCKAL